MCDPTQEEIWQHPYQEVANRQVHIHSIQLL